MIVKINDKEIELKRTLRSVILFEAIAKKTFAPKTTTDMIFYFYATVLASEPDLNVTLDDFIAWMDENPSVIGEFSEWLIKVNDIDKQTEPDTKKKTKKASKKS